MVKLICMDVDGTLVKDDKTISDRTRDCLLKIQEKGVKLSIATGRPDYGISKYREILELDKYDGSLLTYNGGKITTCKDDRVIFDKKINRSLLKELFKYLKTLPLSVYIFGDDALYTTGEDVYSFQYSYRASNGKISLDKNLLDNYKEDSYKIMLSSPHEELLKYKDGLYERFGKYLSMTFSDPFYFELLPKDIDKGQALVNLKEYYGIDMKDIIAFGDSMNDLEMLKMANVGVAMLNANESLKNVADYITLSNEDDGIVHYIEKFLL